MQSQQLLTESQVFKDELLPGTESADHPSEEMPERHDHGKNLIGTIRIQLFAKSFILQVYDVAAGLQRGPTRTYGPGTPVASSSVCSSCAARAPGRETSKLCLSARLLKRRNMILCRNLIKR